MSIVSALTSIRDLTSTDPSPTMVPLLTRVLIVPLMVITRQIGGILLLSGGGVFLTVSLLLSLITGQPMLRTLGITENQLLSLNRQLNIFESNSDIENEI